jgi:hypothetical protein
MDWAKQSSANRSAFYNFFHKLIPLQTVAHVNVKVEDDRATLAATMVEALARIIAARRDGNEGAAVIIDNSPQEPEPLSLRNENAEPQPQEPQPVSERSETVAEPPPRKSSPRLVQPPRQLTPAEAKEKAKQPLPQPPNNAPSTTEQFLQWGAAVTAAESARKTGAAYERTLNIIQLVCETE